MYDKNIKFLKSDSTSLTILFGDVDYFVNGITWIILLLIEIKTDNCNSEINTIVLGIGLKTMYLYRWND